MLKMDDIISKELVKEVMNVESVEEVEVQNGIIDYEYTLKDSDFLQYDDINLYEFIHKNCKEWALSKGYEIHSGLKKTFVNLFRKSDFDYVINDLSENESVLKACEWIMEQK